MSAVTFAHPLVFLLAPLPLLVVLLAPATQRAARAVLQVPGSVAAILDRAGSETPGRAMPLLPWLCWLSLVLALAAPQRPLPVSALPTSGREIYLVIDVSGSMRRDDFLIAGQKVSRLDAVKSAASDFIARRGGDRIGLALFAEQAYVAAPASFDLAVVRGALADATIGVIGTSTAIGDGLGLALKRLRSSDARSRVVVLLSDGSNTAGRVAPDDAARLAADLGITVHTIAFGTEEKTNGPGAEADAVDTETLSAIATAGRGRMFRVRTTEELAEVYRAIEALEASAANAPPAALVQALWPYAAAAAFGLAMAMLLRRARPA